jgi:phosphate uptake regulator
MKNEITIPILMNDLKEKDKLSAAEHRKKYSSIRDKQAEDFNKAIVARLAKDKLILESNQGIDPEASSPSK